MKLRHIGVVVRDMEKSLELYRDLLGLKIIKDYIEKGIYIDTILSLVGTNLRIVKLVDSNNSILELLEYKFRGQDTNEIINGRQETNDIGYCHLAYTVQNVDNEYKRLKEKGIIFNSEPQISPDNKAKVCFCKGPDGTMVELVEEIKR